MFSFNNTFSIDAFNSSKNKYTPFFDSYSKKNNTIEYIGSIRFSESLLITGDRCVPFLPCAFAAEQNGNCQKP